MPQVYFLDNYCYEIGNTTICVYKYDIFDQTYIKIDQFSPKQKLPRKYEDALRDIQAFSQHEEASRRNSLHTLEQSFANIQIASTH